AARDTNYTADWWQPVANTSFEWVTRPVERGGSAGLYNSIARADDGTIYAASFRKQTGGLRVVTIDDAGELTSATVEGSTASPSGRHATVLADPAAPRAWVTYAGEDDSTSNQGPRVATGGGGSWTVLDAPAAANREVQQIAIAAGDEIALAWSDGIATFASDYDPADSTPTWSAPQTLASTPASTIRTVATRASASATHRPAIAAVIAGELRAFTGTGDDRVESVLAVDANFVRIAPAADGVFDFVITAGDAEVVPVDAPGNVRSAVDTGNPLAGIDVTWDASNLPANASVRIERQAVGDASWTTLADVDASDQFYND
ncbi:MAG: hypothetical protein AAGK78_16865, partial [Planctomycetota bacterium]